MYYLDIKRLQYDSVTHAKCKQMNYPMVEVMKNG